MIAQSCSHFGWTFDYVVDGIDWRVLQRMLIDSPRVVYDDEDTGSGNSTRKVSKLTLTPETSEKFLEQIKQIKA